jgi:hypothetical protein
LVGEIYIRRMLVLRASIKCSVCPIKRVTFVLWRSVAGQ